MSEQHDLHIDRYKMAALSYNPDKPGPPIVFMHGIGLSIFFWDVGQTPYIREQRRWLSLSLPGHYPATFPDNFREQDLTVDMLARIMTEAIRDLVGSQPVILVGHSAGGFAALNIAIHTPEIAQGLVIISGFSQGKWTGALGPLQWLAQRGSIGRTLFKAGFRSVTLHRAVYRANLRNYAADVRRLYGSPDLEATLDRIYPAAVQLDLNGLAHYFNRMPGIDITDDLPTITAPTLVMAGDADPIVPPAQARLIADRVPDSELVLFKGVGHLPMAEHPDDYHRTITDWIQKL